MRKLFLALALLIAVPAISMAQYVQEVSLFTAANFDSLATSTTNSDTMTVYVYLENKYQTTQVDSSLGWLFYQVSSADGAVKFDIDAAEGIAPNGNPADEGLWSTDVAYVNDNATETLQITEIDRATNVAVGPNYIKFTFRAVAAHREDSIITASFFYLRADR